MENAHIYENARQQVCIKADVCTRIDGGIEISKYVQAVSRTMGVKLRQAHGTVSIISDERTSIVLYEENQFYALSGVAVSYTHLDVYKRQEQLYPIKNRDGFSEYKNFERELISGCRTQIYC